MTSLFEVLEELAEITEQLVSGGYDATEGEDGSKDTTWTDFGLVCGIAERLGTTLLREQLAAFYTPEGVDVWLADAAKKGRTLAENIARVEVLMTGAFS